MHGYRTKWVPVVVASYLAADDIAEHDDTPVISDAGWAAFVAYPPVTCEQTARSSRMLCHTDRGAWFRLHLVGVSRRRKL